MSPQPKSLAYRTKLLILGILCWTIGFTGLTLAKSTQTLEQDLKKKLQVLQQEIAQYRQEIVGLRKREQSLQGEIATLGKEIQKIRLQIQATDLELNQNNAQIKALTQRIDQIETQVNKKKELMSSLLFLIYEQDQRPLVELFFNKENFSSFFSQSYWLAGLQERVKLQLDKVKELKKDLLVQKQELEEKRAQNLKLKALQYLQKGSLSKKQAAKKALLKSSQVRAAILEEKASLSEKAIAEIRNRLYVLKGLPSAMSLEQAFSLAKGIAYKVGIRPAFLLAVLKKESDWGGNIGGGHWQKDMHPSQRQAFAKITKALGLDPGAMPVSAKPSYGWGGAMGPAQFLPKTWLAYQDKIARLTGHYPPSPWNLEDAFAAAALKLARAGANHRTYETEWKAAMVYFAGGNWNNPAYSFYGDQVMDLARVIQEEIE